MPLHLTLKCRVSNLNLEMPSSAVVAMEGLGYSMGIMRWNSWQYYCWLLQCVMWKLNSVTGLEKIQANFLSLCITIGIFSWTCGHNCYQAKIFALDQDWIFYCTTHPMWKTYHYKWHQNQLLGRDRDWPQVNVSCHLKWKFVTEGVPSKYSYEISRWRNTCRRYSVVNLDNSPDWEHMPWSEVG